MKISWKNFMKWGVCPEMGLSSDILEFPGKFMDYITPPFFVVNPPEGRGVTVDPIGLVPLFNLC